MRGLARVFLPGSGFGGVGGFRRPVPNVNTQELTFVVYGV